MNNISVSYILATKDRPQFLEKALANIAQFITDDDELIVVEGGQGDATRSLLAKWPQEQVRLIEGPDISEGHAYNKGLLVAQGEILKPLADDDYIYPEAMRQVIAHMRSHPTCDAVIGGGMVVWLDTNTGAEFITGIYNQKNPATSYQNDIEWVLNFPCVTEAVTIRHKAIAQAGLFDSTYVSIDADYYSKLLRTGCEIHYYRKKLFKQIVHKKSTSLKSDAVNVDIVRVFISARTWLCAAMRPTKLFVKALGLHEIRHGYFLGVVIQVATQLVCCPKTLISKIIKKFHIFGGATPVNKIYDNEMQWDGSVTVIQRKNIKR